jgi:PAN domain
MDRLRARSSRLPSAGKPSIGKLLPMIFATFAVLMQMCGATAAAPSYQPNVDLPGDDYKTIDMMRPRPRLCQEACLQDSRCQAWTFVRTGVLGAQASCWLKSKAEPPQTNSCCVSGVK